jgi:hypothetical protein
MKLSEEKSDLPNSTSVTHASMHVIPAHSHSFESLKNRVSPSKGLWIPHKSFATGLAEHWNQLLPLVEKYITANVQRCTNFGLSGHILYSSCSIIHVVARPCGVSLLRILSSSATASNMANICSIRCSSDIPGHIVGVVFGRNVGVETGTAIGITGAIVGTAIGTTGAIVGAATGTTGAIGTTTGAAMGATAGKIDGTSVGPEDGDAVGTFVDSMVGVRTGDELGMLLGTELGMSLAESLGESLG